VSNGGREQLAARVARAAARDDLSMVAEILADAISENRESVLARMAESETRMMKRADQVTEGQADNRRTMWMVLLGVLALCGTILTFAAVVVFL
jgi:hypothetical protein